MIRSPFRSAGDVADLDTSGFPPNALDAWDEVARNVEGRLGVLFLDFDGTLTPIVQRPEQAVLNAEMKALLVELVRFLPVVLVSGRAREDLIARVGLPGLIYAGSHGFDISSANGLRHEVAAECVPLILDAAEALRCSTNRIPGVFIEEKRFSVAVHYRMAAYTDTPHIMAAVDAVLSDEPRLQKRFGKKVVELRPAVVWHKGEAVAWICARLGLDLTAVLPIYIGDDLTDEDAFATIAGKGVSIVVTQLPRPTRAHFSLRNVSEVRRFLARFLEREHPPVVRADPA